MFVYTFSLQIYVNSSENNSPLTINVKMVHLLFCNSTVR